jgi:hypothetical protein
MAASAQLAAGAHREMGRRPPDLAGRLANIYCVVALALTRYRGKCDSFSIDLHIPADLPPGEPDIWESRT